MMCWKFFALLLSILVFIYRANSCFKQNSYVCRPIECFFHDHKFFVTNIASQIVIAPKFCTVDIIKFERVEFLIELDILMQDEEFDVRYVLNTAISYIMDLYHDFGRSKNARKSFKDLFLRSAIEVVINYTFENYLMLNDTSKFELPCLQKTRNLLVQNRFKTDLYSRKQLKSVNILVYRERMAINNIFKHEICFNYKE